VREFCDAAFAYVGLDYRDYVITEEKLIRRVDTVELRGDISKAQSRLGWKPSVSFKQLVHLMVDADRARLAAGEED
jgi:GDPmannose 4,6-dehydratase